MNGFDEAANFLEEAGLVRGYLPPRHLRAMRGSDPFVLITITAAGAPTDGDMVVGIQAGCQYRAARDGKGLPRKDSPRITFHYSCPARLSLLLEERLPNARKRLLKANPNWGRGPTKELKKKDIAITIIENEIKKRNANQERAKTLLNFLRNPTQATIHGHEPDSEFDYEVSRLVSGSNKPKGKKIPQKKTGQSQAYDRDPAVAAYARRQAKGNCHDCKKKAPFIRRATGQPFLEVHHIHMLKDGGSDTTDNVIALCPNCHRKRHYW